MYKLGTTNLESELEQVHDGSNSDSDSGSNSRLKDNSEEQWPNPSKKYLHMFELRKDMRNALRRDLFWNLARLLQESQLDIEKTFELQKDLIVKMIVSNLMKTFDLYSNGGLGGDGVLKASFDWCVVSMSISILGESSGGSMHTDFPLFVATLVSD
ncbi:hypothetical protein RclHR1_14440005 [Rhizophagus clarus]|uniref:Uncharacterized protein n=1 Tax=Rhizophagus clarus TaxID=94130 RepID=A0A2Z6R578_9GLOM|nr:hypothetical protein RclHR1_14440005 [Rhizophagus clarus]